MAETWNLAHENGNQDWIKETKKKFERTKIKDR